MPAEIASSDVVGVLFMPPYSHSANFRSSEIIRNVCKWEGISEKFATRE